ncbi:DUF2513 domain-containing protein [Vibrio parahaemolyticus]|uniref:DUF2513 domain-containing protein n=1 Tax=Vibrio parahaemolyticus TaxID=670 RepID=UPI0024930164|nr:DUF2513 domain-containing protein [Vibrio parahaemolyticus]
MKRNMEMVRNILLKIESHPNQITDIKLAEHPQNEVYYHIRLMIDAGILDGDYAMDMSNASSAPAKIFIKSMTWEGHELLDNLRKDEVWSVIKDNFKNDSIGTVITVAKDLAVHMAKKKLDGLKSI